MNLDILIKKCQIKLRHIKKYYCDAEESETTYKGLSNLDLWKRRRYSHRHGVSFFI